MLGNGGGIRMDGGAKLTLANTTVTGNSAAQGSGGGIFSTGVLTVTNSTVRDNIAFNGGGISIFPSQFAVVTGSTINNNTAAGVGGGISNAGNLAIVNSTISGNRAQFRGGGVENESVGTADSGRVTITNSTLQGNQAAIGGGVSITGPATTTLRNTIVANSAIGGNCAGQVTEAIGSLSWPDATCPGLNADPRLGPLASNGGPTQTHALLPGSAAIDAAVPSECPDADQRGVARPQGPGCDIGAFEAKALSAALRISIDIKPGGWVNSVNSRSRGRIPVAILSTATFNAPSRVATGSLTFGSTGNEPSFAFCNKGASDVNGDGRRDLMCHFVTQLTGFQRGDTHGVLRGRAVDGTILSGIDTVRIVH